MAWAKDIWGRITSARNPRQPETPEYTLVRDEYRSTCTLGSLSIGGATFETLEPPWKNNERNVSCIPEGRYLCKFLKQSASGKYKNCFHVTKVPDRVGILIHNGNLPTHTLGCIILGSRRGWLANKRAVLASRAAMTRLALVTGKSDFYLTVRRA